MFDRQGILTIAVATACSGCVTLVPGDPVGLVDVLEWRRVYDADDPFAGEGGSDLDCDVSAAGPYDFGGEVSFDITTDGCSRITVAQPAMAAIGEGDVLALRGWFEKLTAPEPTTTTLALAIGGTEQWRAEIPVPSEEGGPVLGEWIAPQDWPAGTPVAWHVHNHGKNSYHLFEVVVRPLTPARALEE